MAISLQDNTYIKAGKPSEAKTLKGTVLYADVAEANSLIPISERHLRLFVNTVDGLYWYKDGVESVNLIKFQLDAVSDEYICVIHVDELNGDDNTAKINDSTLPYASINKATTRAKLEVINSGTQRKSLVRVRAGVYYEWSINREFVDMYFDFGAIVISNGPDGTPIFTDILVPLYETQHQPLNIKVKGYGQFYHLNFDPDQGNLAVGTDNINTKVFELECYELDGALIRGGHAQEFIFSNLRYRFNINHWSNKILTFINCKFLGGLSLGKYICINTTIKIIGGEIILPSDNWDSLLNIYNNAGSLQEVITIQAPEHSPLSTSSLTRVQVTELVASSLSEPLIAALFINVNSDNNLGSYNSGYRVDVTDTVLKIRKERCTGVEVIQSFNEAHTSDKRGYLTFKNLQIEDETTTKDTTSLVIKKLNTVTLDYPVGLSSIISNCTYLEESTYTSGYERLPLKYDNIPLNSKLVFRWYFQNGSVVNKIQFPRNGSITLIKVSASISTISYSTDGGSTYTVLNTNTVVSYPITSPTLGEVWFGVTYVTPTVTSDGSVYLEFTQY